MFDNISWSTSYVFEETLNIINSLNLSFSILGYVSDIDTIDDMRRYLLNNGEDSIAGSKIKLLLDV